MHADQFLTYLQHPDQLLALPVEELRELAVRFPYSANLRLLSLLKAELEETPDAKLHLERAAAASFDRAYLHELLASLRQRRQAEAAQEGPEAGAEVLELRELDELEPLLRAEATPLEVPPLLVNSTVYDTDLPSKLNYPEIVESEPEIELPELNEEIELELTPPAPSPPPLVLTSALNVDRWVEAAADYLTALPDPVAVPDPSAPFPPPSEPSLPVPTTPRPEAPTRFLPPTTPPGRSDALQQRLARLREQSLAASRAPDRTPTRPSFGPEPASETLAQVLVDQQQYPQAIRMYRRLMLSKPQKKAIFAALIDELKAKL